MFNSIVGLKMCFGRDFQKITIFIVVKIAIKILKVSEALFLKIAINWHTKKCLQLWSMWPTPCPSHNSVYLGSFTNTQQKTFLPTVFTKKNFCKFSSYYFYYNGMGKFWAYPSQYSSFDKTCILYLLFSAIHHRYTGYHGIVFDEKLNS